MRSKIALLLAALFILALVTIDLIRAYDAARSIEVKEVRLKDVDIDIDWKFGPGFPPVKPVIKSINLRLAMLLRNPSSYTLRIRELTYNVSLWGRRVGQGRVENLAIPPGGRTISIPISLDTSEAIRAAVEALMSAMRRKDMVIEIPYEVEGKAKVPVTFLGFQIGGADATVPFKRKGIYRLSLGFP